MKTADIERDFINLEFSLLLHHMKSVIVCDSLKCEEHWNNVRDECSISPPETNLCLVDIPAIIQIFIAVKVYGAVGTV